MPDEFTADSDEYRELQRIAKANHELLQANGADRDADAEIAKLRKRLGADRAAQINLIATCVSEALRPVLVELKRMHERVAALEGKLANVPKYVGAWRSDKTYSKGDIITFDGGMWHADEATRDRPGTSASGWTLAVKSGRR